MRTPIGQKITNSGSSCGSRATNFLTLHTLTAYNPSVANESITAVELTASVGSLATNVASLQFVFSGFENGGTAYREFDVIGSATAVPEPSTYAAILGAFALAGTAIIRRRASRVGVGRPNPTS